WKDFLLTPKALAILRLLSIVVLAAGSAQAQTYSIVHSFQCGANATDGSLPLAGLIRDSAGNLYGTTSAGGVFNQGMVFELSSTGEFIVLHSFAGSPADGDTPFLADVLRDTAGNLYGVTQFGGTFNGGTVFKLSPDGSMTILRSFPGSQKDGYEPSGNI